jgi:hypothetical protein
MTAELVHVIHTLPAETPGRWVRPVPVEGIAELPTRRSGTQLDASWVWTRGDGIWWCRDCRCRVLCGRCTNVTCHNTLR